MCDGMLSMCWLGGTKILVMYLCLLTFEFWCAWEVANDVFAKYLNMLEILNVMLV
jgi:hypothetical protein